MSAVHIALDPTLGSALYPDFGLAICPALDPALSPALGPANSPANSPALHRARGFADSFRRADGSTPVVSLDSLDVSC